MIPRGPPGPAARRRRWACSARPAADAQALRRLGASPGPREAAPRRPAHRADQACHRARFLRPDDPAFAERIFEASDLMPVRYLALGQWAARPVGRIHLRTPRATATPSPPAPRGTRPAAHQLARAEDPRPRRRRARGLRCRGRHRRPARARRRNSPSTPMPPSSPTRDWTSASSACAIAARAAWRCRATAACACTRPPARSRDEYATIIQHPHGRQKHIALRENRVEVYVYDAEAGDAAEGERLPLLPHRHRPGIIRRAGAQRPVVRDRPAHRRGVPKTRRQLREGFKRKPGRKPARRTTWTWSCDTTTRPRARATRTRSSPTSPTKACA